MNHKPLTIGRLSVSNIKRKPLRTAGLIIIVALVACVVFAGGILSVSMKNGLENVKARFGADLMVVPLGYDEGAEGILLKGEPAYFYFDRSVEQQLRSVEGIKTVSAQFYLTSLSQDCCDIPVQFIGFDPDTDFTVQPWISEVYSRSIKDGELIIGYDITADDGHLKFFNQDYTVAARLEKTGTGLDGAVYANINTLVQLFSAAKASGLSFVGDVDPKASLSSVLIQTKDGYTPDEVAHNIHASIDGIQVIKTTSMMTGIADNLGSLIVFLYGFAALFLLAAFVMLTILFTLTAHERKKEFAILRVLGASSKKLSQLVLSEALFISGAGGIAGIAVAAAVVFSFNTYIGDQLHSPYLQPGLPVILGVALVSLVIAFGLGPLAAAYSAAKLNRREVYLTMREGEL